MEARIIRFPAERRIPPEWRGHPSVSAIEAAADPALATATDPLPEESAEAALSIDIWVMGRETPAMRRRLARALRATLETLIARELVPTLAGTERHPVVEVDVPGPEPLLDAAGIALEIADRLDEIRNGHGLLGFALGVGASPTRPDGRDGDSARLASRLREAAPSGAVLLGGSSWPELSDQLLLRRAPELAPLIADRPVSAFLLEGQTAVPETAPSRTSQPVRLKSV
jgi:class 3 adenylate cyclase